MLKIFDINVPKNRANDAAVEHKDYCLNVTYSASLFKSELSCFAYDNSFLEGSITTSNVHWERTRCEARKSTVGATNCSEG